MQSKRLLRNQRGQSVVEMAVSLALIFSLCVMLFKSAYGVWANHILEQQSYEWLHCKRVQISANSKKQCDPIFKRRLKIFLPFSQLQKVQHKRSGDKNERLELRILHFKKFERSYQQSFQWP